jgi:hypothetical protein
MITWLATTLIDSGWVKTGLFFRWFVGTEKLMYALSNEKDLATIKRRYERLEQSGFFSGQEELSHKQAFIKSLFLYDSFKTDAYSKALAQFHSWNGRQLNYLEALLGFIKTTFFQGAYASELKQTFIEATLAQNNRESNAIAHTAWAITKSIKVDENPLSLLLDTLDEAGCFNGPKAEENQHLFINAITKPNKKGENALCQSAEHVRFDSKLKSLAEKIPNFFLLMDRVQTSLCLEQGKYAQTNKEILSEGLLLRGELRSVMDSAMHESEAVEYIFNFLNQTNYFSKAENKQNFFDILVRFDKLNRSTFYSSSHDAKSLQLVRMQLKVLGFFSGQDAVANKARLINAIIKQSSDGTSALSEAIYTEVIDLQLQLLEEADCFTNDTTRQEFIDAVFAGNKYGMNCLYHLTLQKEPKLIETLKTLKFLEGPNAEKNKANFIMAVLSRNTLNGSTALYTIINSKSISFIIEHLTTAGCFSGPNSARYKQLFIDAVLSKDKYGNNVLSNTSSPKAIILLLQKLTEAGCFNSEINKAAFIEAVKNNGNSQVFRCMNDSKTYLVLRKALIAAGFNSQDLKDTLNQSVSDKYSIRKNESPFMKALKSKDVVLVELLKRDGAELSKEQANKMDQDQKRIDEMAMRFKDELINDKDTTLESLKSFQKQLENPQELIEKSRNVRLKRSVSFSELSTGITLFDKTDKEAPRAQDDSVLLEKSLIKRTYAGL